MLIPVISRQIISFIHNISPDHNHDYLRVILISIIPHDARQIKRKSNICSNIFSPGKGSCNSSPT